MILDTDHVELLKKTQMKKKTKSIDSFTSLLNPSLLSNEFLIHIITYFFVVAKSNHVSKNHENTTNKNRKLSNGYIETGKIIKIQILFFFGINDFNSYDLIMQFLKRKISRR